MSAGDLCLALLHDSPEERVVCMWRESIPGALSFICRNCLGAMLDARAVRMEHQEEDHGFEPLPD
jgi:hypothetical protein